MAVLIYIITIFAWWQLYVALVMRFMSIFDIDTILHIDTDTNIDIDINISIAIDIDIDTNTITLI